MRSGTRRRPSIIMGKQVKNKREKAKTEDRRE
jgi:hypothetical protein